MIREKCRSVCLSSILSFLLCMLISLAHGAKNYSIDLQGPGCDAVDGYYLKDKDDTAIVFSLPLRTAMAGRDSCEVLVKTDSSRLIQYVIETVKFNECGIDIYVEDSKSTYNHFTCSNMNIAPGVRKSSEHYIRIRTRQPTPEARGYEFKMILKNDLGPVLIVQQSTTPNNRSSFSKPRAQYIQFLILLLCFLMC